MTSSEQNSECSPPIGISKPDVRMRGFRDRSEVSDVIKLIEKRITKLGQERIPLDETSNRILSQDVTAKVDVPGFDRSAMDGYAVHGEETFGASSLAPCCLEVIGSSMPGQPFTGLVHPGQAVRIMTGSPIPDGADAVIMAEHTQLLPDNRIEVTDAVAPGRHIGIRGEDISINDQVLHSGRRLRPQDLGLLSSIGIGMVPVFRKARVAIIITGDELLPAGHTPSGFQIADSNSVMLNALVRRDRGIPTILGPISDQRDKVREAINQPDFDCVLVSGGSSVGAEDHAPTLVAELGELTVHGIAMRPSSPAGLGFVPFRSTENKTSIPSDSNSQTPREKPVFLLPGNPVSCLCAYDFFAGKAIRIMSGGSMDWPYRSQILPLARKITSAVGRVDYTRIQIEQGRATPLATSGASILSSTTRADGFVIIGQDSEGEPEGNSIPIYLYD